MIFREGNPEYMSTNETLGFVLIEQILEGKTLTVTFCGYAEEHSWGTTLEWNQRAFTQLFPEWKWGGREGRTGIAECCLGPRSSWAGLPGPASICDGDI